MSLSYQAILLIAFGGPTSPDEIRPFLDRVTKGISIPPERLEEVALHYAAAGGKSPFNEITFRQADALRNLLNERNTPLPVYVGMRNSQPFFVETLKQMAGEGVNRALGFILSSHRTEASWERYQKNIADARDELGGNAPAIDYCGAWHDHPLFVQTWAELIDDAFAKIADEKRDSTPLLFTAHSIPIAMAARSPYVAQIETSAKLIAEKLDHQAWSIAYQSQSGNPSGPRFTSAHPGDVVVIGRSGKPIDPWLGPDIGNAIRDLATKGRLEIVVASIGFVCDHVEVLYDLDIEAKKIASDLGLTLIRASCPNDHPTFIRMMVDMIEASIKRRG